MNITVDGVVQSFKLEEWRDDHKTAFTLSTDTCMWICRSPMRVGFDQPANGQRVRVTGDWSYLPGAMLLNVTRCEVLK